MAQHPELLNYDEAAEYLGLSPFTVHRYVSQGFIRYQKLGLKLVRFRPEDLDRFIQARIVEPRR